MQSAKWRRGLVAWAIAGTSACTPGAPSGPIRTVGDVIRLPPRDGARGRPVELRGVVTLLDPAWELLAIQDATGAVLVQWPAAPAGLRLGQKIAVAGATSVDNHVPSIVTASIRSDGDGHLPAPEATTANAVACGEVLYRRVEIDLTPEEGGFGDGSHTARYAADTTCGTLTVIGRLFRPRAADVGVLRSRIQRRVSRPDRVHAEALHPHADRGGRPSRP